MSSAPGEDPLQVEGTYDVPDSSHYGVKYVTTDRTSAGKAVDNPAEREVLLIFYPPPYLMEWEKRIPYWEYRSRLACGTWPLMDDYAPADEEPMDVEDKEFMKRLCEGS
jgi:hypothetical protein